MKPQRHGKHLSYYRFGATTFYASRLDPRCSYCLYVPESYSEEDDTQYPLAVIVHGTERRAEGHRDAFADFAEKQQCIVLAPLFPAAIGQPEELHNYKYLEYEEMRFDLILLDMVEEISQLYRVETERFLLSGFSGGGHFAHRFLYVHPERLMAVAVGAPGVVTLLDPGRAWPAGVAGVEKLRGKPGDLLAVQRVPVQLFIGAEDTETWEIGVERDAPYWIQGVNEHGVDRQAKMSALKRSLEQHRVNVRHDVLPGIAHEGFPLYERVKEFFGEILAERAVDSA